NDMTEISIADIVKTFLYLKTKHFENNDDEDADSIDQIMHFQDNSDNYIDAIHHSLKNHSGIKTEALLYDLYKIFSSDYCDGFMAPINRKIGSGLERTKILLPDKSSILRELSPSSKNENV